MSTLKNPLPQMNGGLFLTDGGIETTLIYHDGFDLPPFAAFDLFKDERGIRALRRYFARHASIARQNGMGFILESATWRASRNWPQKLQYSAAPNPRGYRQGDPSGGEHQGQIRDTQIPKG